MADQNKELIADLRDEANGFGAPPILLNGEDVEALKALLRQAADALEEAGRVDLEQFRECVEDWRDSAMAGAASPATEHRRNTWLRQAERAGDLLAIINSHKDR